MEKKYKNWMCLLAIVFAFLIIIGLETTSAQQYFNYVGKVVSLSSEFISVQGSRGDVMYFRVGRNTIYVPAHLPAVGERVKVLYFFKRGYNVAQQVEILPPPPPPAPAPATTVTTQEQQAESAAKEKKSFLSSIFGCKRGESEKKSLFGCTSGGSK